MKAFCENIVNIIPQNSTKNKYYLQENTKKYCFSVFIRMIFSEIVENIREPLTKKRERCMMFYENQYSIFISRVGNNASSEKRTGSCLFYERYFIKISAMLFPHSVATKEYICHYLAFCFPFCSCGTRKDFFMSENKKTRRLIYLSLLIAMNIVFVRLLSFQTPVTRLDFGFVPISLAGAIFGPFWGGVAGGASDILGMLVNNKGMAYFFPWTINAILHGVFYGLFLHKKAKSWLRIILCVLIQGFFVNLFLGSLWGTLYRGNFNLFWIVFAERLTVVLVTMPVQIVVIRLLTRVLKPHVREL